VTTASNIARQLTELLDASGDMNRAAVARLLHQRLSVPESFVSVVGETSTGKSTLIKRALARLNIAAAVLIEVGSTVIEAYRWKSVLIGKVHEAVDGWVHDVRKDFLEDPLLVSADTPPI